MPSTSTQSAPALPTSPGEYLDLGWHAVRIPAGMSHCPRKGWQKSPCEIADWVDGDGTGIVLGPSALVDLDLDCDEAAVIAPILLPPTATFGRKGRERTHYIYEAGAERPGKWVDPDIESGRSMIIELRTGEQYSLFPGSVHWKTNTPIVWDGLPAIRPENPALLDRACRAVAIAVLVARAVPDGARHDGTLALAGCLGLGGWGRDEAELVLTAVARLWGFTDGNIQAGARSTYDRLEAGSPVASWRALAEAGVSSARLDALRNAIGVREGAVLVEYTEDVGLAVDKVLKALRQMEAPLFDMDGLLGRSLGGLLREVDENVVMEEIGRRVMFSRNGKPLTSVPKEVCRVLISRSAWPELRRVRGVSHVPILREDGSVCEIPGYDEETQYWYQPVGSEKIESFDTRAKALEAAEALLLSTKDSWWEEDSDQLAWVSHVLTHLARPAIKGPVPIFLYSANAPGAGKTTLAQAAAWVALGRTPGAVSIGFGESEWAKTLFSSANQEVLLVDNVRGVIRSQELESAVLTGEVSARKFHSQEMISRTWRPVVAITSNGASVGDDIARRIMPVRLNRPEGDSYEVDLRLNRATLAGAGLTILRAYLASGAKVQVKAWQSYSAWSSLVAAALRWIGLPDIVAATREKVRMFNTEAEERDRVAIALRAYLSASKWMDRGCTASEICSEVTGAPGVGDPSTRRELLTALTEVLDARTGVTVRTVGNYLGQVGNGITFRVSQGKRFWKTKA
jgi:Bifunctional DNA primase/polymerase, N-terminal